MLTEYLIFKQKIIENILKILILLVLSTIKNILINLSKLMGIYFFTIKKNMKELIGYVKLKKKIKDIIFQ